MKRKLNQQAFGLLEMLVAVGVLAIVCLGFAELMKNSFNAQKHVALGVDKNAIGEFFLSSTDCASTLPGGTCVPGSLLAIVRRLHDNSLVTIASNVGVGTKYGSWTIKGECDSTGDGINLKAARLSTTGSLASTADADFFPDPLTGKLIKWSSSDSLVLPQGVAGMGGLCTGGNTQSVRMESGKSVLADHCSGAVGADNLCSATAYADVTFAAPFNNTPTVVVTVDYVCDYTFSPCTGGATDSVYVTSQGVTTIGFKMVCNGSPKSGTCGAYSTYHCGGRCDWMAVGN